MASIVGICNKAIRKLAGNTITSIDPSVDNTEEARLCNALYDESRDEVLREHPWNFAIKRASLASLVAEPEWEFSFQYPLPSDCLRLLLVDGDPEKRVEVNRVLTNVEGPLDIKYISQIEDPNEYDSLFINALASKIAFEMAEPLTNSGAKKNEMFAEYQEALSNAKRVDAQEESKINPTEDIWLSIRR